MERLNPMAATATTDALIQSLRSIPLEAVPGLVDALLLSTGVNSSVLIPYLIKVFPGLLKDHHKVDQQFKLDEKEHKFLLAFISALTHLFKKSESDTGAMTALIWIVYIPLLKRMPVGEPVLHDKVAEALAEICTERHAWGEMQTILVPYCLKSVVSSISSKPDEQSCSNVQDVLEIEGKMRSFDLSEESLELIDGYLPLSVACQILATLLLASLKTINSNETGMQLKETSTCENGSTSAENFARQMVLDLHDATLYMLSQPSDCMLRHYAVRMLLPPILRTVNILVSFEAFSLGNKSIYSRGLVMRKVWNCCKSLFAHGPLQRRDAYMALSLFVEFMMPSFHVGSESSKSKYAFDTFDVREEKDFWEELRAGLVDGEHLTRKRALHILKVALENRPKCVRNDYLHSRVDRSKTVSLKTNLGKVDEGNGVALGMTKRDRWAEKEAKSLGVGMVNNGLDHSTDPCQCWEAFILLYEMLEEYGTHLVDAAWSHQISVLLPTLEARDPGKQHVVIWDCQSQMDNAEVAFLWATVLWQRGFDHGNPQVRRLIMQSFLGLDWNKFGSPATLIPEGFVLGPFLHALNDPMQHKDFGLKGVYSSETSKGASKFIGQYSASLYMRDRANFVQRLASYVECESLGRAGLMTLALCIKEAGCGDDWIGEKGTLKSHISFDEITQGGASLGRHNLQGNENVDLVEVLRLVVENSRQHFNPNYRSEVCDHVIVAASTLVTINEVPFDKFLHFLSSFPREVIVRGGVLHHKIMHWFSLQDIMHSSQPPSSFQEWITQNLCNYSESYMKPQRSSPCSFYNDEEVEAWHVEAERWARLLCIGALEEHQFSQILTMLQNHAIEIYQRVYNSSCMPEKLLLLILSLLEECQPQQWFSDNFRGGRIEDGRPEVLVGLVGKKEMSGDMVLVQRIALVIFSILGELVSFARSSSTIFWSAELSKDAPLPNSVMGKLGGPSQRRLPSSATSSVLRAILALKAVSECTMWCAHLRDVTIPDSIATFLWEFCWNVVTAPIPQQETRAEILLGAYEALASVSKAMAATACPHVVTSLEFGLKIEGPEAETKVDVLICTFLHSINSLLQSGALTRSRRAILVQWKWCCLDSLLSILCRSVNTCAGTLSHDIRVIFDSTLKSIIHDAIDSLECASESSILPMLRCVRWVMNWSLLEHMDTHGSSEDQEKDQIMWRLVQSVWAANSDCNKRRVAPIAALLSAVIHPSVFSYMPMHDDGNNKQGPLKWFIERLVEQGIRSPRTMRLTALHLTGMWLLYPTTIKFYMKELKVLTLYGEVSIDEDLDGELIDNYAAAREFSTLVQSTDPELTEAFVNSEMYVRVTVAVLFHKLAESVQTVQQAEDEDRKKHAHAASNSGKMFLLELLDSAVHDADLSKELYKKSSAIHRRKSRAWQMMCILSQFVDEDILQQVTFLLHKCLYRNNLPAVRQYIETFAMQIYLKFPSIIVKQMVPILCDYSMKPQALSSYVFIAANVLMHISPIALQIELLEELLPPMLPFLTSHHHSLRSFSQILVYRVLHKFLNISQLSTQTEPPSHTLEQKCLQSIMAYLEGNADCTRLRFSVEKFLDAFDPIASATPRGLFCFNNGDVDPSIDLPFECVPVSVMEHVINFLNEVRGDLRYAMAEDAATIKNEELMDRSMKMQKDSYSSMHKGQAKLIPASGTHASALLNSVPGPIDGSLDFQKKILLHSLDERTLSMDTELRSFANDVNIGSALAEIEIEDRLLISTIDSRIKEIEKMRGGRQELILVASLLGRVPNLAGLARTCEVFKVASLVIADATIIQDKQFQLISVTAEKWIPIQEVPEFSLKQYLEGKKSEGFSILGLEQTANSVPIDKYSFPRKTVLVLGREKEGIPVDIIHVLDTCVEIPQFGVIRSLNVHVSGAIAIWEYTRQHRN